MTDVVNEAAGQIERAASTARETLSEAAGQASQTVRRVAEGQRERGADAIESIAKALHIAARELGGSSPMVGRYVDGAAGSLVRGAQAVRDESPSELLRRTTELARQQPMMTFAGAILAGIAMSRFIKSTRIVQGDHGASGSNGSSASHGSAGSAGSGGMQCSQASQDQSGRQRIGGSNYPADSAGVV